MARVESRRAPVRAPASENRVENRGEIRRRLNMKVTVSAEEGRIRGP